MSRDDDAAATRTFRGDRRTPQVPNVAETVVRLAMMFKSPTWRPVCHRELRILERWGLISRAQLQEATTVDLT